MGLLLPMTESSLAGWHLLNACWFPAETSISLHQGRLPVQSQEDLHICPWKHENGCLLGLSLEVFYLSLHGCTLQWDSGGGCLAAEGLVDASAWLQINVANYSSLHNTAHNKTNPQTESSTSEKMLFGIRCLSICLLYGLGLCWTKERKQGREGCL